MAVEIFLLSQLCSLFMLTVVTDAESCSNQNTTDWSGTFQPSSYPSNYAPNLDCYWLIQVSDGNLIEINFQDFAMDGITSDNCPNDYVEVLEGFYGSTSSIKRLCGQNLPFENDYRTVRSKGSSLLVHMHTDNANENRGFAASHQGICQVTFSTVSGTILSPGHPNKYPNSVKCEWIIDLCPGYDITLTFLKFNLEKKDDCSWDWLTVQAGNSPDSPEVTKVCGDELPPDITTSGPMRIYFETDNDNEFEGFHMTWVAKVVTDAESCPNQNVTDWSGTFQPSSYPSNYAPNLDCYWLIQVSDGNLIEINFQDFAMDGVTSDTCPNDYVEVLEGSYGSTDSIKRLCGESLSFDTEYRTVRSKGSSLLVHLHTDDANENRGFAASHQGICQVTFSTMSGTIMSPSHPDKYPNNVKCEWIIDLGLGYDITLTFHKFNLEKKDDCSWDWLTVQAGNTTDSPEIARVCGDRLPPDITTSGPMRIYFETDNDNEFEGFHMTWVAKDQNECNTPGICHSNATCANTEGSYRCTCMLSYTGDGKTCQYYKDFDECNLELDNCHEDALCINTPTHFECECKDGFLGDGINCTVSLTKNATESVQSVAGVITVPTTQTPNPVTAATVDIRSANSREFVADGITVTTTETPNPVTVATVDVRSANSKELVQSGAAVRITVASTSASDPAISAIVDERSADTTVMLIFHSLAASKTEPWFSYVVLMAMISCFNLLISI